MIKNTRWGALLLASLMLLISASSVFASTSSFTTWPAQTTKEVNKVWTISFNSAFLNTSINSNTIYVENSKRMKVVTIVKPSADGLSVTVTPATAYTAGKYNLYITNQIMSRNNVKLSEQIILPFTVVVTPTTPIIDVNSTFNSLVTSFTVKTTPAVYKVNVNKMPMQYAGDCTYTAGVYGATQGSIVVFDAYDQNGILLQTYKYSL